jgi:tetratricopeptide (TPR) repeat protein
MSDAAQGAKSLHEALVALQQSRMGDAAIAATTALEAFTAANDPTGSAAAHQVLAMSAAAGGDFAGAIAHVDAAIPLRQSTKDAEGLASLYQERFELCLKLGDVLGARRSMESQYKAHEQAGDREGAAHAMHQLAQVLLQEGETEGAEELVQQALMRLDGPAGARGRSALHLLYANIWMVRSEGDKAMRHAREALDLARSARFRPGEIDAIQQIGTLHAARQEWDDARRALQEALSGRELLKDLDGRAHVLRELALVELAVGEVDEAIEHLDYASRSVREAGNWIGEVTLLQLLQSVADEHGRPEIGLRAGTDLVVAAGQTGDPEAIAASHFALGSRQAAAGDLPAARASFETCLKIQSGLGLQHESAVAQAMLGQIVAAMGDVVEGRRLVATSLATLDLLGSEAADAVRPILAELDGEDA